MLVGDQLLARLARAIDAAALRQKVVAHNIANLNTAGFKRSSVTFSGEMDAARKKLAVSVTHDRHLFKKSSVSGVSIQTESHTSRRSDGNNVDLEKEMLDLISNQLYYNTLTRQVSARFADWRLVINEGRR